MPGSQTVRAEGEGTVAKARIAVSSQATPNRLLVGEPVQDRVTISGAASTWRGKVDRPDLRPVPTEAAIRCDGQPAVDGIVTANGSGRFTTPAARLNALGWYTYVHVVPGDANHVGLTTPCRAPNESFRVETQPRVQTIVSSTRVQPGTAIHDRVMVSGLAGQRVTVQAALYGPFGARTTIACTGTPVWTGSLDVERGRRVPDGRLHRDDPGLLHVRRENRRERIRPGGRDGVRRGAGDHGRGRSPRVTTTVSSQRTRPGATITDRVVVTGLGRLSATVQVACGGRSTRAARSAARARRTGGEASSPPATAPTRPHR